MERKVDESVVCKLWAGGKVGSWRSGSRTQLSHQSRKVQRR